MRLGEVTDKFTPGRGAPSSSITVPWTIPVTLVWARASPEKSMRINKPANDKRADLGIYFLLKKIMRIGKIP
jgi:hypothetical protein